MTLCSNIFGYEMKCSRRLFAMDKKVTVIIPVYNVELYLEECLESVIHQSLDEIEVICVNDKSTDSSSQILEEYEKKDGRIRVINCKENRGLSSARNVAIDVATGKYIYFLDSDDYIADNALEVLYNTAERFETDIVFFDSLMFYEDKEITDATDLFMSKFIYSDVMSGAQFLGKMRRNDDIREPVWIQFWRKSFLDRIELKFYDGILHEDLLFTFVSLMEAQRVKCINEQLHFYRIRKNAITSVGVSERHISGLVKTYVEIFEYWSNRGRDKGVDFAIEHYLDRISWKINRYMDIFKDIDGVNENLGKDEVAKHMFKLILEPQFKG